MPAQMIKCQPNPATAQRVAEVNTALASVVASVAPAAQKAAEEIGRSFAALRRARA